MVLVDEGQRKLIPGRCTKAATARAKTARPVSFIIGMTVSVRQPPPAQTAKGSADDHSCKGDDGYREGHESIRKYRSVDQERLNEAGQQRGTEYRPAVSLECRLEACVSGSS